MAGQVFTSKIVLMCGKVSGP